MMQQISPQLPANHRERVLVGDQLGRKSAGLRYGEAMVCGEARQREDRAADCEVVSGMACGNDVWFIRSGILRLQRYGYDGRRQILSLFLPGEIVGVEGEFREGVSVETATRSSLCRIDRHKFNGMVDQNEVLRAELFRQKQDQLDRLHWLTWSLGALSAEERLCAFLALSSKFMPYHPLPDGTSVLSMCLARKDIADLLGTTVESISRIIHKLSDIGIIQIKDPAHFGVRDLNRLIEIGRIDGLFDRMIACGSKPFSIQHSGFDCTANLDIHMVLQRAAGPVDTSQ
jgi:CRP-like cAMP-binding protein